MKASSAVGPALSLGGEGLGGGAPGERPGHQYFDPESIAFQESDDFSKKDLRPRIHGGMPLTRQYGELPVGQCRLQFLDGRPEWRRAGAAYQQQDWSRKASVLVGLKPVPLRRPQLAHDRVGCADPALPCQG